MVETSAVSNQQFKTPSEQVLLLPKGRLDITVNKDSSGSLGFKLSPRVFCESRLAHDYAFQYLIYG